MSAMKGGRGQSALDTVFAGVVSIVTILALVSFATPIIGNFQGNLVANPQNAVPFANSWQMIAVGLALLVFVVGLFMALKPR